MAHWNSASFVWGCVCLPITGALIFQRLLVSGQHMLSGTSERGSRRFTRNVIDSPHPWSELQSFGGVFSCSSSSEELTFIKDGYKRKPALTIDIHQITIAANMCMKTSCGTCRKHQPTMIPLRAVANLAQTRPPGGVVVNTSPASWIPSQKVTAVLATPRWKRGGRNIRKPLVDWNHVRAGLMK